MKNKLVKGEAHTPSSADAVRGETTSAKPSPKKALANVEDRMLLAAAAYLKEQGWHPVVISADRIEQKRGDLASNYELVLRFTGRRRGESDAG